MGLFSFISGLFTPVSNLVDELHFSGEERGNLDVKKSELRNRLAEIESKVATKLMELQTKSIEANSKMEIAAQEHGNLLSKSWRPIASLCMIGLLVGMGMDLIVYRPLMVQIAGGFLGLYGIGRSYEKKK